MTIIEELAQIKEAEKRKERENMKKVVSNPFAFLSPDAPKEEKVEEKVVRSPFEDLFSNHVVEDEKVAEKEVKEEVIEEKGEETKEEVANNEQKDTPELVQETLSSFIQEESVSDEKEAVLEDEKEEELVEDKVEDKTESKETETVEEKVGEVDDSNDREVLQEESEKESSEETSEEVQEVQVEEEQEEISINLTQDEIDEVLGETEESNDTEEEEEEVKEEKEPEVKEEKKAKKPARKRKTKAKAKANDSEVENEVIDVFGDKKDFNAESALVLAYFQEDDWEEKEQYFLTTLQNIRIEPDMNPGTLKYVLAELSNLNDEIMPHYIEQKKLLESLTNKDFGIAYAYKVANSYGSNSEERKRSGIQALMNVDLGGHSVNYIALISAIQMRFTALDEIVQAIKYKSNICITMSGALKMEQQLLV